MKKIYILLSSVIITASVSAQDTFSICAVDSVTGQVGSAGATCITSSSTSAIIISDVHPNVGVIHTQSWWLAANQNYARTLMNSGYSPQQIIDSVTFYDAGSDSTIRQYGAVDLNGGSPRSAAFTGSNCYDYKNHITGPGYSVQGNILLGQQILDSMQSRYLNTPGSLACKLMAAMQGAKVVGADTRCLSYGISSYSAFLRVANPGDTPGNFFFDLTVNTYPGNNEPIDSLQIMFDNAGGCSAVGINETNVSSARELSAAFNSIDKTMNVFFGNNISAEGCELKLLDVSGKLLLAISIHSGKSRHSFPVRNYSKGIYLLDAVTLKSKKHYSVKVSIN
ncbi:MAG TPA: DUF1028 domain-containing protein [Bacteroidia bacterium]|nr:DUF1028 domain-containing protein [Bacteroidia bacterium]